MSKSIGCRVSDEIASLLDEEAQQKGVPTSTLLKEIITKHFNEQILISKTTTFDEINPPKRMVKLTKYFVDQLGDYYTPGTYDEKTLSRSAIEIALKNNWLEVLE